MGMKLRELLFLGIVAVLACPILSAQVGNAGVKVINDPSPNFPPEAGEAMFGDKIVVSVAIDKSGKVSKAGITFMMIPCDDKARKTAERIGEAALRAAKETTFEPFIENGKPVERALRLTYSLKPREQPVTAREPKTIVGGVINGRAKSLAKPDYPAAARAARIGGAVSVQVLIAENGRLLSAAPLSGHPELYGAAVSAACRSEFEPTKLEGNPVKVSGVITYNWVPPR